jgi:hypothetical protein
MVAQAAQPNLTMVAHGCTSKFDHGCTPQMRPKVKDENPSIGFGDVTKKVAEAWALLTDKEKEVKMAVAMMNGCNKDEWL